MTCKITCFLLFLLVQGSRASDVTSCSTDDDCEYANWGNDKICGINLVCVGCSTDADCNDEYRSNYKCKENQCEWYSALSGCTCDDACAEDYNAKLMAGSIVGFVLGIIVIVVASVPLCCGYDANMPSCPKLVGVAAILCGIIIIFVPIMGVSSAADGAAADTCAKCDDGCTEEEEQSIENVLGALGFIIAYTAGMGFLSIIVGVTASILGCCVCGACCGPLKTKAAQKNALIQPAPVGTVVVGAACATP